MTNLDLDEIRARDDRDMAALSVPTFISASLAIAIRDRHELLNEVDRIRGYDHSDWVIERRDLGYTIYRCRECSKVLGFAPVGCQMQFDKRMHFAEHA